MATKIQIRRDTAANWTAANTVLAACEIAFEIDGSGNVTGAKTGNGTAGWNSLPYGLDATAIAAAASAQSTANAAIPSSHRGAANGVSSLDTDGLHKASEYRPATTSLLGAMPAALVSPITSLSAQYGAGGSLITPDQLTLLASQADGGWHSLQAKRMKVANIGLTFYRPIDLLSHPGGLATLGTHVTEATWLEGGGAVSASSAWEKYSAYMTANPSANRWAIAVRFQVPTPLTNHADMFGFSCGGATVNYLMLGSWFDLGGAAQTNWVCIQQHPGVNRITQTSLAINSAWHDGMIYFDTGILKVAIDGVVIDEKQPKGGDLICDDVNKQIMAAVGLLKMWKAKEYFIVAGTGYHCGDGGDENEEAIAAQLCAQGCRGKFFRKLNIQINGWFRLQCRHFINSSAIPHGRMTPQMRSKTWGALNAAYVGKRPPHLSIYSHVHYWTFAEDAFSAVITTPAWEAIGGRYGDEKCDGHTDIGAVALTIGETEKEGWQWEKRLYPASVVQRTVQR